MKTCAATGCGLKHFALGYCRKHHARFVRKGHIRTTYDMSGYCELDGIKDTRPGHRGTYSVNVINDIKYKARKRGKDWRLTHGEALELITAQCEYCGFKPDWPNCRVGIDRINNKVGYLRDNCVSCCFTCNSAKGQKSISEFKGWAANLIANLEKIVTHK